MKKISTAAASKKKFLRWARALDKRLARERRDRPHLRWLARRQAEINKFYRREARAFRRGWEVALWEVVGRSNGRMLPAWASDALVEHARQLAPRLQRKGEMGRQAKYKETQRQMEENFRTYARMQHYIEDLGCTEAEARRRVAAETYQSDGGIRKRYRNAKLALKSGDYYYSSIFDCDK